MTTKDKIEETLTNHFTIDQLKITDDSHLHAGHAEAVKSGGGHYSVFIISSDFKDKPLVSRHRMINESLKPLFQKEIHALKIQAKIKEEVN